MFLFLVGTSIINEIPSETIERKTMTVQYPDSCDSEIDIRDKDYYSISLKKGRKECFLTKGTLFLNGEAVKLTAYDNGVKLVQADGVAITAGSTDNLKHYVIKVESSMDQTVTVIGGLDLKVGTKIYVTTRPITRSINVLSSVRKIDKYYHGYFLQLCANNIDINYTLGIGVKMEMNGKLLEKDFDQLELYTKKPIFLHAWENHKDNHATVSLRHDGEDWVTPYKGYLTISEATVYTHFSKDKAIKKMSPVLIGSICGVLGVVLVGALVYVCVKNKCTFGGSGSGDDGGDSDGF